MALSKEMQARRHALTDVKRFIGERYLVADEAGRAELAAIMRGYVAAYLLGLVAVIGGEETREFVREMLPPPERASKPRLVINNQPAA